MAAEAGGVGPGLCLFSAACFGAMAVFGKLAYADGVSPGALLLLRFGMAAAVLGLLLLLRPGLRPAPRPAASGAVASGPAASGPAASGPAASGPAASGPAASGPAASGPAASGPAVSGAVAYGPAASGAVASGPAASGPAASGAVASGSAASGAAASGAVRRGRPGWRLVVSALALGAVGYATQATLYFSALKRIDAPLVALVLYTFPAMVTVAAALLGRERLTPARCAALLVASVGTLLVLLGGGGVGFDRVGVGLAFGAAVAYTAYILVADTLLDRLAPVVLAALVMTGAAATLAVRAAVAGGVDLRFPAAGWVWVALVAVVSTVLAMLALFGGLRRTGPSTAAILSTFEPVVTTVLAAIALDEFLTAVQLAGAAVVLSSVAVLQLRPRRVIADQPPAPVPARDGSRA